MPHPHAQLYIVDDDPSVRTAYARLARSAKMAAGTFASVEEFMEADVSDENACVICDVGIPGKGGPELPELLARAGRHLPVIFVTAHNPDEMRAIAQRVGAAGCFSKPVDDQALLDAIAWALSGHPTATKKNDP